MQYISVRNFKKFQHYRDRNPPWIKIYTELLDSDNYEFTCLQDASKLLLIFLWMLASRHENRIPNDISWLKKRIPMDAPIDISPLLTHFVVIMEQNACNLDSETLADCLRSAIPETETEEETERETESSSARARKCEEDVSAYAETRRIKNLDVGVRKEKENTPRPIRPDLENRKWLHVTDADWSAWSKIYPNADVRIKAAQLMEWLLSNPKSAKTNYRAFLTNNFARENEKPKAAPPAQPITAPDLAPWETMQEPDADPDAPPVITPEQWIEAVALLKESQPAETFETWIATLVFAGCAGDQVAIRCESNFFRNWIISNEADKICAACREVCGADVRLKILVSETDLELES